MGKKFYEQTEKGGILFQTTRRVGDVRIPNYVYDMWMPLLGATVIGVYGVYCRLEMNGAVRKISMEKLAQACRIGKSTLSDINEKLVACGFISIRKPEKVERLMHWTLEIVIHDPPKKISAELIAAYKPEKRDFSLLTPWLESQPEPPTVPNGTAITVPNGTASIEALDVAALEGCSGDEISEKEPPTSDIHPDNLFPPTDSSLGDPSPPNKETESILNQTDPIGMAAEVSRRRGDVPDWAVLGAEGIDLYYEILLLFCKLTQQSPPADKEDGGKWLRALRRPCDKGKCSFGELKEVIPRMADNKNGRWCVENNKWPTPGTPLFQRDLLMRIRQSRAGPPVIDIARDFNPSGAYQPGRR